MEVVVGIPLPPDYRADVRTICMAEAWSRDTGLENVFIPSPSPEEGRDKIVAIVNYMIPRPTHILFLDSDVLPRPRTMKVLYGHDKDIVTGVVPICRKGAMKWNVSREDSFVPMDINGLPNNPFKVQSCGFGVVLVKTTVFDKMEWPYWRSEYKPGLRTLGEDIYFSKKARAAGFDIWCDPKVKCNHATRSNFLSIIKNMKGNK